jgi:hypothetical protein
MAQTREGELLRTAVVQISAGYLLFQARKADKWFGRVNRAP